MKFRPLHDRVVVNASRKKQRHRAGSSFPIPQRKSPSRVKSSPSAPAPATRAARSIPLDVKVGDRVLFGKWSGSEVKIDGQDLLIMKESDILGVLEGKASVRQPPRSAKRQSLN